MNCTPRRFTPPVPIEQEAGEGGQGRSERFGKEKNLLTLRDSNGRPPARSLVLEVERVQIRYFSSARVDKYFNSKIRWSYLQALAEISGVTKFDFRFDIRMSVHRKTITNYRKQDAVFLEFAYSYRCSTCFRRFLRPSSGAHNCTYSFRYCQPILLLAATVEEMDVHRMELHLLYGSS